jgi:arsenite methyltransferase
MSEQVRDVIRDQYGALAKRGLSNDQAGVRAVAEAFGYSPEQLAAIPAEANLGVSCGNPTAFAGLKPGEVVVDLGAGGGLDVFLAADRVGPTGKAIGIDMTSEMLELARRNAARGANGRPFTNVEFHLASIEQVPLENESTDCVISNCVINLASDKPAVFREIFRILKPGGRLAVSDIALKQTLPAELGDDLLAYAGCISGAILIDDYRQQLLEAGFSAVEIIDTGADLNAYAGVENQAVCCAPPQTENAEPKQVTESLAGELTLLDASCCSPGTDAATQSLHQRLVELLQQYNINDFAASVRIFAVKPA